MRMFVNYEEGLDSDDCNTSHENMAALIVGNCDRQKKDALTNAVEKHLSEEIMPASDFQRNGHEPAHELRNESGEGNEAKVNHMDDEPEPIMEEKRIYMIDSEVDAHSEEKTDYGKGKEMLDTSALAAFLNTANFNSEYGSAITGLDPSIEYARPALTPSTLCVSMDNLSEEEKKRLQNLQRLKVKFLRLVQRLGFTANYPLAAQVIHTLTAGKLSDPAFSFEDANQEAIKLEAQGKDDLDFSLNILVLGKTGVGKSATINSIFGEEKVKIDAFKPKTSSVQEICGVVNGVKIRIIDAPGLKSSVMEQGFNKKVLAKVNKFVKKYPPDVILYIDRLDSQTSNLNDVPMLRTITSSLGSSIWQRAFLTLTHASSAPPDGSLGMSLSYDIYVSRVSQIIQQSIVTAVDDYLLLNLIRLMPVSLVENHIRCRQNRKGEKVLPNGETWRNQLLLQCYAKKILSEVNSTSKPRDSFGQKMLFRFLEPTPPLAYLVSSLLKTRAHPELPSNQGGGIPDSILDFLSDEDQEEEDDEYYQLPPFRSLRKSEISNLSKDHRKAYFEEYDYRVKLLQKKQWREQCRSQRDLKKKGKGVLDDYSEVEEEPSSSAPPEISPDRVLPLSFDSDNPTYRYRSLEGPKPLFSAIPFLDAGGWDHDCGYYGVLLQSNTGIAGTFPAEIMVQLNKDKDIFKINLDSAISAKHGESGSSLVGFETRTIDEQQAYILRGESKLKISKKNKTIGGLSVTLVGDQVSPGIKFEHEVNLGKRLSVTGKTGSVGHHQNAAYAANLEVRLRGEDYPVEPIEHLFALNLLKYKGEMAVEANIQPQIMIGRSSKMNVNVSLNSKSRGHIMVTTSSSNPIMALLATSVSITLASFYNYKAWISRS